MTEKQGQRWVVIVGITPITRRPRLSSPVKKASARKIPKRLARKPLLLVVPPKKRELMRFEKGERLQRIPVAPGRQVYYLPRNPDLLSRERNRVRIWTMDIEIL